MPKAKEAADEAAAQQEPATEAAPVPDILSMPELRTLLGELRRMGPRRAARHELSLSTDLIGAIRSQLPGMKPNESKLFGVPFVVDGNMDGIAYKLTKKETPK